jgi:hypothetical protein
MSDCEHREIQSQDCYPPILWCQRCHKTSHDQGHTWVLEGYWLEKHQREVG